MTPLKRASTIVAYVPYPWHHPVTMLRVVRPYEQSGITVLKGCENGQVFPERISQADAVLVQREFPAYGFDGNRSTAVYEQIVQLARQANKPLIYEIDDLLLEIPEEHPDHALQYYTAALFPMLRVILEANLVTTSTPALQRYYQALNPNTYLLPNYLDDSLWKPASKFNLQTRNDGHRTNLKPVIIGYMGSGTHAPDLEQIAPALERILRRFGEQVRLRFWGARPPSILYHLSNVEWIELALFNYSEFASYFSKQVSDIFIAPLIDSFFNQCKSPLKYFEYSIQGIPGVYSKVAPYEQVIHHGQDGLLASSLDDWENDLSALIQKPSLRFETGLSAQENVLKNWLLSEHAGQWAKVLETALTGKQNLSSVDSDDLYSLLRRLSARASGWQRSLQEKTIDQEHEIDRLCKLVARDNLPLSIQQVQNGANPDELRLQLANIQRQMDEILDSESWKIGQFIARTRQNLLPEGSWQMRIVQKISRVFSRGQSQPTKPGLNAIVDEDRESEHK